MSIALDFSFIIQPPLLVFFTTSASCPKLHLRSYVRKIQPYTADRNLWVYFFHDSLSGTQLEWFYQLEGANVRNWEDLAAAFYKQYQYNTDLSPTRTQLQGMSMGTGEGFKDYAQKWRDLAGRVQPPCQIGRASCRERV